MSTCPKGLINCFIPHRPLNNSMCLQLTSVWRDEVSFFLLCISWWEGQVLGWQKYVCPNSVPFLVVWVSLGQVWLQREDFWEVDRTCHGLASPPWFWPLLNSSSWLWHQFVSTALLIGTSCCESCQVNGYYNAWPGRADLVSDSLMKPSIEWWAGPSMC